MHLKFFTKAPSHALRLLPLIVLLLVSTTLILARLDHGSSKSVHPSDPKAASGMMAQSQGRRSPVQYETEVVTITPTGFEPGEITRAKGPFILAIENRSGLDEVEFYFERETGSRLDLRLSRKRKLAWHEVMDLSPGNYILRAVDYNDWRFTLSVTP